MVDCTILCSIFCFFLFCLLVCTLKMPTNSQTSAPSYVPIVTSKRFPSLFIQGFSLLNKSDFLEWYDVSYFFSEVECVDQ